MEIFGRLVPKGMGGFLNPPTHPEHDWSVRYKDGSCSLGHAATADWLDATTRNAAKNRLNTWTPPDINSPEIKDWIRHVLGYFKNCYKGPGPEPHCWNASNLHIQTDSEGLFSPLLNVDEHAGVHFIRNFYHEYTPIPEEWAEAYWGKKPETATL